MAGASGTAVNTGAGAETLPIPHSTCRSFRRGSRPPGPGPQHPPGDAAGHEGRRNHIRNPQDFSRSAYGYFTYDVPVCAIVDSCPILTRPTMQPQTQTPTSVFASFPAALRGGIVRIPVRHAEGGLTSVRDGASHMPAYNCSGQRPAASGQRPAASGQRPAASGQRPAASGQRPAASGQRPAASGQRPAASGQRPAASGQRPAASGQRPAASGPNCVSRRPALSTRLPAQA